MTNTSAAVRSTFGDEPIEVHLSDVHVLEAHRGRGLSKWMMSVIMTHPDLQGLRRFSLSTRDARGLYEPFGFQLVANPQMQMEILRRDIYLTASSE